MLLRKQKQKVELREPTEDEVLNYIVSGAWRSCPPHLQQPRYDFNTMSREFEIWPVVQTLIRRIHDLEERLND